MTTKQQGLESPIEPFWNDDQDGGETSAGAIKAAPNDNGDDKQHHKANPTIARSIARELILVIVSLGLLTQVLFMLALIETKKINDNQVVSPELEGQTDLLVKTLLGAQSQVSGKSLVEPCKSIWPLLDPTVSPST